MSVVVAADLTAEQVLGEVVAVSPPSKLRSYTTILDVMLPGVDTKLRCYEVLFEILAPGGDTKLRNYQTLVEILGSVQQNVIRKNMGGGGIRVN